MIFPISCSNTTKLSNWAFSSTPPASGMAIIRDATDTARHLLFGSLISDRNSTTSKLMKEARIAPKVLFMNSTIRFSIPDRKPNSRTHTLSPTIKAVTATIKAMARKYP